MEWYWIVLITLLIYWAIGTTVFVATNEDDVVACWFCCGFWALMIKFIAYPVRKWQRYREYKFLGCKINYFEVLMGYVMYHGTKMTRKQYEDKCRSE